MKRAAVILMAVLVAACGFAQVDEVHYLDSATFAWSETTTDADGNPLLDTDTVSYEVYVYNSQLSIDDQDPANLTFVAETSATQQTIDFSTMNRGLYYAGVRAKVVDGQGATTYSPIAWSYDSVATNPTPPFGYIPMAAVLVLPLPTGLMNVQQ